MSIDKAPEYGVPIELLLSQTPTLIVSRGASYETINLLQKLGEMDSTQSNHT